MKIVIPAIVQKPSILIDKEGYYSNDKTCIIASHSNFLLAVLNSSVTDFFMRLVSSTKQGGFFEYKPVYLSKIPIPPASEEQKNQLEELVTHIMTLRASDPGADTSQLESDIDRLVYSLFDLSEEEIGVIEGE